MRRSRLFSNAFNQRVHLIINEKGAPARILASPAVPVPAHSLNENCRTALPDADTPAPANNRPE